MNDELERRAFNVEGLVVEQRTENGGGRLIGHAAVFDIRSVNLGGFVELIKPGAFSETIKDDDIRALFNHDDGVVLGRKAAGTLTLAEDATGLKVEIDVPDNHRAAADMLVSIERGDISQMSFGFRVKPGGDQWAEDDEGVLVRTLSDVKLFEVSPVTFPAYPDTDVAVRSMDHYHKERGAAEARKYLARHKIRLRSIELAL